LNVYNCKSSVLDNYLSFICRFTLTDNGEGDKQYRI
jgi:hypothetical protein